MNGYRYIFLSFAESSLNLFLFYKRKQMSGEMIIVKDKFEWFAEENIPDYSD